MQGHQGGRAGRIHRHGWSVQIVDIRQTIGRNTHGIASHHMSSQAGQIIQAAHAVIQTGNTDIYRTVATGHAGGQNARVFHGLPGQLQQQTLLRIQPGSLTRGNAKEIRIELVDTRQDAGRKSDTTTRFGSFIVLQLGSRPSIRGDFRNQVALFN